MKPERPDPGTGIDVVFTKWDGTLHWHGPAEMLGSDDHGAWLAVRNGVIWRKGAHGDPKPMGGSVFLIPDRHWWLASFPLNDPAESLYVDVATPAAWTPGRVQLVDLDLDVLKSITGEVRLLDEDEFDEHRAAMSYPPEIVDSARTTAARLVVDVTASREPFGSAASPWMDLMVRSG